MLNRFTARRFRKDSDGNVAMMTALAMVVLLMGAGAAVDYSLLSNQSSSLQNVSDAAVLAAATSGETDEGKLLEIAQSVIELHHPDAENLSVAVKLVEGIVVVDVTSTREVIMKGFFGVAFKAPLDLFSPNFHGFAPCFHSRLKIIDTVIVTEDWDRHSR